MRCFATHHRFRRLPRGYFKVDRCANRAVVGACAVHGRFASLQHLIGKVDLFNTHAEGLGSVMVDKLKIQPAFERLCGDDRAVVRSPHRSLGPSDDRRTKLRPVGIRTRLKVQRAC